MMKRFIVSIILFGLFIISFGNCESITPRESIEIYSTRTKSSSCNGYCCFLSYDSPGYTKRYKISYGNQSNLSLFPLNEGYELSCFEINGNFDIYNGGGSIATVYKWDMTSFIPSTSCPTCPTCQTCNTGTINIFELSDPQYPVYSDSTANGSFNYNIYYNDYVHYTRNGSTIYFTGDFIPECEECPESPSCPSTGEILSGYILESSIDSSYCIGNGYCPIDSTGSNWSSLFINGIQHDSFPIINIDIIDNVPWNYSINNDVFDLDIGSGYDQDFIDSVIDTQKSKPSKTDFNNTISGLIPLFIPGLVIILFIYFVFRFIKKIF